MVRKRVVVRSSLSGKGVGVRTCVATADVDGVAGDVGAVGACGIELVFSEPRFNFAVARFEPCVAKSWVRGSIEAIDGDSIDAFSVYPATGGSRELKAVKSTVMLA